MDDITVNSWGGLTIQESIDGDQPLPSLRTAWKDVKKERDEVTVQRPASLCPPRSTVNETNRKEDIHVKKPLLGSLDNASVVSWGGMTISNLKPTIIESGKPQEKTRMISSDDVSISSWGGMTLGDSGHHQKGPIFRPTGNHAASDDASVSSWGACTLSDSTHIPTSKENHKILQKPSSDAHDKRSVSSWGGMTLATARTVSKKSAKSTIATVAETSMDSLKSLDSREARFLSDREQSTMTIMDKESECLQLRMQLEDMYQNFTRIETENQVLKHRISIMEKYVPMEVLRELEGGSHSAPIDSIDATLPTVPLEEGITLGSCFSNFGRPSTHMPSIAEAPSVTSGHSGDSFSDERSRKSSTEERVENKEITDPSGEKGTYTGVTVNGVPHGLGHMIYDEGQRVYDGEWKHGRWNGFGLASLPNGDYYEGEFKDDLKHGKGRYEWNDGRVYDGEWQEGSRHGQGEYRWTDGSSYTGEFRNSQRDGKGVYRFTDGGSYDGSWKNGLYCGFGTCIWADGRKYEGQWLEGMPHGDGIETSADGNVRHGLWCRGDPISE